jgi:hypothetical protein
VSVENDDDYDDGDDNRCFEQCIPSWSLHLMMSLYVADTARLFKKHLRSLSSLSFLDNVTDGMMEEEGNLLTD